MRARLRPLLLCVPLALLGGGGVLVGDQLWLAAKAELARQLIDNAFAAHLRDGEIHRPWHWADTYPIAMLEVPRLGVRRAVLSGATGASLAFGVGHVDGSVPPNRRGNCALAGHRDSWFAFLQQLEVGDEVRLETRSGIRGYRVSAVAVHSMWDVEPLEPTEQTRLTLITCYPFGGLERSSKRYVVTCVPVAA